MSANNNPPPDPPKERKNIQIVAVLTYFCSGCSQQLGEPDELKITEPGQSKAVDAVSMTCPFCQADVFHKRLVLAEP